MNYTSVNNPRIKALKKLQDKKYRDQEGLFLVEGFHLVNEAYNANILEEVFIVNDIKLDVKKSFVTDEIISYLSKVNTPQKIIGLCKKIEQKEIKNKVIALDNIQDPGNLGAIIRSAVAFNFDTILLSNDTVDIYNEKVIRASQGMLFKINFKKCNLLSEIDNLKNNDYQILATNVKDGKNIKNLEKKEKLCIIMGNEGNGVSEKLLNKSDEFVYIKTNDNCESLNVSVAAGIILYELGSE